MISFDYKRLHVVTEQRVVTAVIDNPPLNLLTPDLLDELDQLTTDVSADPDALVLVLKSADPDIFMTHAQFAGLYDLQPPAVPASVDEVELNRVQVICERLRTMNKVTIAQVEGRVAGGSAAMVMACDIRFGSVGRAVFNTMSVPVGSVPGGGASQYMPRLVGYSRAMELILGGLDLDAATAERWGYLNRALDPEQIEPFVTTTARRIAACPPEAVRATKEVIAMSDGPIGAGLREEAFRFRRLFASSESRAYVSAFLELGGETRDGEQHLERLLGEVLERMRREAPDEWAPDDAGTTQ
jgi:enoyl-CoA hydratase/carnithine racemase